MFSDSGRKMGTKMLKTLPIGNLYERNTAVSALKKNTTRSNILLTINFCTTNSLRQNSRINIRKIPTVIYMFNSGFYIIDIFTCLSFCFGIQLGIINN